MTSKTRRIGGCQELTNHLGPEAPRNGRVTFKGRRTDANCTGLIMYISYTCKHTIGSISG
jgi:hypothetical protein